LFFEAEFYPTEYGLYIQLKLQTSFKGIAASAMGALWSIQLHCNINLE